MRDLGPGDCSGAREEDRGSRASLIDNGEDRVDAFAWRKTSDKVHGDTFKGACVGRRANAV